MSHIFLLNALYLLIIIDNENNNIGVTKDDKKGGILPFDPKVFIKFVTK
tara:strand:- start:103 stop:249 length:147 start_codon:yes stop_codon:yes gene_type:complete